MSKAIQLHNEEENIYPNPHFPVGSIYLSVLNTNPSKWFGGTWEQIAKGRTLVGVDTSDTAFNKVQKTGGSSEKYITKSNLPSRVMVRESVSNKYACGCNGNVNGWANICLADAGFTSEQPMDIMPPYFTCYIWCRTA